MWHEARKQEKKIRGMMVDLRKRAERRRDFYEKIKLDPTQYLRVVGTHRKINLDQSTALAAEGPQSMQPWQGDSSIMIDRFDGRSHLDYIAPPIKTTELSAAEIEEERAINYERYRILVQNECIHVSEEHCLQQIRNDELFGAENNPALNAELMHCKTKKKAEKKAAIGYTYDDEGSTTVKKADDKDKKNGDGNSDSESDDEEIDLDIALDLEQLTNDQIQMLNSTATTYGMKSGDYFEALYNDKKEAEQIKMVRLMEEERAQFTGRKSRRERRACKDKSLIGKQHSPPSYAARKSPEYDNYQHSPSQSRSPTRSPSPLTGPKFITSFGAGSSDEEGVLMGPALPPHLMPKAELMGTESSSDSNGKHHSCDNNDHSRSSSRVRNRSHSSSRSRSRRRSRSRSRRRSKSRSRHRSRSRSRRRSRSRSRNRNASYRRDSRSYAKRYRSSSMDRRRSRSKSRRRSRSRRRSGSKSRHKSRDRSRTKRRSSSRSSSSDSYSSRSSYSSQSTSRSRSSSVVKPIIKRYRRDSLASNASNDSLEGYTDDTPKMKKNSSPSIGIKKSTADSKTSGLSVQQKMKRRMQIALSKNYKADKQAEQERIEKSEQDRIEREDELRVIAMQLRRREREKRHKDDDSDQENEIERLMEKERGKEREKERERQMETAREDGEKKRAAARDKERDKEREREREKERERERDRDRERERDRERDRHRNYGRDRYGDRHRGRDQSSHGYRDNRRGSYRSRSRSPIRYRSSHHRQTDRQTDTNSRKPPRLVDY